MAITSGVTAQQMGHALAEAVRDEPRAAEIWVATHSDAIQLWLICVPITLAEHRSLTRLEDVLYERFPGVAFDFHILNPRNHPKGAHRAVPRYAERVAL